MIEDWRYERKFYTVELDGQRMAQMVKLNPNGFRIHYPSRKINNVYYDTESLILYHRHIEGNPYRKKIRVRWYGEGENEISPILEIKEKEGFLSRKERIELNRINLLEWKGFGFNLEYLDIPEKFVTETAHLKPFLVNSYWRKYFVSLDKKVRLTLDTRLSFCDIKFRRVFSQEKVIVELKYARGDEEKVSQISKYLPLRLSKFSKYVEGIECLYLV